MGIYERLMEILNIAEVILEFHQKSFMIMNLEFENIMYHYGENDEEFVMFDIETEYNMLVYKNESLDFVDNYCKGLIQSNYSTHWYDTFPPDFDHICEQLVD